MLFYEKKPYIRQVLRGKLDDLRKNDLYIRLKTKDSRLFYILSGHGTIKIQDMSYPVLPDMAILFKAATEYEYQISEMDYYVVNFDYDQRFSHVKHSFHPFSAKVFDQSAAFDCGYIEDCTELNSPIVIYNAVSLKRQIKNLITESSFSDEYAKPLLSSLLQGIIIEILRLNKSKNVAGTQSTLVVKQIIEYIYDNYTRKFSNKDIAEVFGYNPSYIGRLFKKHTGVTLHDFILELRLETAMELLTTQNLPIGEICNLSGFSDFYHFSKMFKQRSGCTPSQYREHHIKTAKEIKNV